MESIRTAALWWTRTHIWIFLEMKEKYAGRIELLFGVEAGLQPDEATRSYFLRYLKSFPFDFIIGSSHVVNHKDPYYPEFYDDYPDDDTAYRAYFTEELENARLYGDMYDSYGHLDYILRYGKTKNKFFTYEKFADVLDPLLEAIISAGRCIEINTAGFRKGMGAQPSHRYTRRPRASLEGCLPQWAPMHMRYLTWPPTSTRPSRR